MKKNHIMVGNTSGSYGSENSKISSKFNYDKDTNKLTWADTEVTLDLTSNAYYFTASDVIKDATQLEILLGQNVATGSYSYWVATRFIDVPSSFSCWCMGIVWEGYVVGGQNYVFSTGKEQGAEGFIRPIVSLKSNVTTKQVPVIGPTL